MRSMKLNMRPDAYAAAAVSSTSDLLIGKFIDLFRRKKRDTANHHIEALTAHTATRYVNKFDVSKELILTDLITSGQGECKEVRRTVGVKDWEKFASEVVALFPKDQFSIYHESGLIVIWKAVDGYTKGRLLFNRDPSSEQHTITIEILGDTNFVDECYRKVFGLEHFDIRYVDVMFYMPNERSFARTPKEVDGSLVGKDVYYPFLGKPVKELAKDFFASTASVLLLIGEPGTGKSTLLRSLIMESTSRAGLVFGSNATTDNNFMNFFLQTNLQDLYIEDADVILAPRNDGNSMMAEMLNGTDGVMGGSRKLIISTNLSSINKVDKALLRDGRCYAVLNFRKLSYQESLAVLEDSGNPYGLTLMPGHEYSLANLLCPKAEIDAGVGSTESFGFVAKA